MRIDEMILWCQCSSGLYKESHHVSYGLENGWEWFFHKNIEPFLDAGGRRVLLHLPFGRRETGRHNPMRFDGWLEAEYHGKRYFLDRFNSLVNTMRNRRAELIVYLGRPGNTESIVSAHSTRDQFERVMETIIRMKLPNDVAIALDNISSTKIKPIDVASSLAIATYGEATPEIGTQQFDWNLGWIIRWPLFVRRHVNQHPAVVGRFPKVDDDNWYGNEVIVLATPGEFDEAKAWVESNPDAGVTLAPTINMMKLLIGGE